MVMYRVHSYDPGAVGNGANLPQGFLGVDRHLLEVSAGRQRSMADLRVGLSHLDDSLVVSTMVDNGRGPWETTTSSRHVTRGAALAQLLLEQSIPDFQPSNTKYFAGAASLEPGQRPDRSTLFAVKNNLVLVRRSTVLSQARELAPGETAQNEGVLSRQIDEVLGRAGLSGFFETAVEGLTGPGLEEPTRELDAKYGAALVALGVGIAAA